LAGPAGLTATDLAGLAPEDIATIVQGGLGTAQVGRMAVGEVLGIPEREARVQLTQAQTGLARKETEAIVDAQQAFEQQKSLIRLRQAKTPEEIDLLRAQAESLRASGKLNDAQAEQVMLLLDEKEQAEKLGNEKKVAELNEYIALQLPGGEVGGIQISDLIPLLAAQAKGGAGPTAAEKLAADKYLTQQEQTAVEIEEQIQKNAKSPEARARYQDFNRYSTRSKVAVNDGGKIKFVKLPKVNGKLITARQVYAAAAKLNMSVEEYLVNILKVPEAIKMLK